MHVLGVGQAGQVGAGGCWRLGHNVYIQYIYFFGPVSKKQQRSWVKNSLVSGGPVGTCSHAAWQEGTSCSHTLPPTAGPCCAAYSQTRQSINLSTQFDLSIHHTLLSWQELGHVLWGAAQYTLDGFYKECSKGRTIIDRDNSLISDFVRLPCSGYT